MWPRKIFPGGSVNGDKTQISRSIDFWHLTLMPSCSLALQKWGVEVLRTQCGKLLPASHPSSPWEFGRTT